MVIIAASSSVSVCLCVCLCLSRGQCPTYGLSCDENVVTLGTRVTHGRVESGMLVMWCLLMMVLMRSSMVLVCGACHSMRQETVLVETGGIHSGKDGGRLEDVKIGRCDDDQRGS